MEEAHANLYKEAMNHLLAERETTYYVCLVCGYVADGIRPEICPVCGAKADQFMQLRSRRSMGRPAADRSRCRASPAPRPGEYRGVERGDGEQTPTTVL